MTLVTIVMAPNADNSGPDLDRLEKVEDLDPEIARNMLQYGTARKPSDAELAAYHKARQPEPDETATDDEPAPVAARTPRTGRTQPAEPAERTPDVPAPAAE